MKNQQKPTSPEIMCIASMGNEPGLDREMYLTLQARTMLKREIDKEKDPKKKQQLLRSALKRELPRGIGKPANRKHREQIEEMRAEAGTPVD